MGAPLLEENCFAPKYWTMLEKLAKVRHKELQKRFISQPDETIEIIFVLFIPLKEATKSQLHLHKHTCTHTPLLD
jgi:hypothetical protein